MNEYKVAYHLNTPNGKVVEALIYGKNEKEAKSNAVKQGLERKRIVSVAFSEPYRGYGHI